MISIADERKHSGPLLTNLSASSFPAGDRSSSIRPLHAFASFPCYNRVPDSQREARLRMLSISVLLGVLVIGFDDGAHEAATSVEIEVVPAAMGLQMVRASIPFPKGLLATDASVPISTPESIISAAVRPLTYHPSTRFIRRGIVTFPYRFTSTDPVRFSITGASSNRLENGATPGIEPSLPRVGMEAGVLTIELPTGPTFQAIPIVPRDIAGQEWKKESVERNAFFEWVRFIGDDEHWPLIIEVRVDSLGGVAAIAHLQRKLPGDGRAPDFGWRIEIQKQPVDLFIDDVPQPFDSHSISHTFKSTESSRLRFADGKFELSHPTQHLKRRGGVELHEEGDQKILYRYLRCSRDDLVPMQERTWQRAEFVVAPVVAAKLTSTLSYPHQLKVDPALWDELYQTGKPLHLEASPELQQLVSYHHEAIIHSMACGDDWGNVTSFSDGASEGGAFGMNRLNHCPPIFEEGYRSGDRRLIETSLLWCDNFYDQSIWWGDPERGGTRYNNMAASGKTPPDHRYMWRSNNSVHFCTKGYDSFLLAYEETGDPRMMEALLSQTAYAKEHVHTGNGECRNIGDVRDFMRLYRDTAEDHYRQQGMRLFRELVPKISPEGLFSQSGHPLERDGPFIDDDDFGYKHPFAKPYIIGYALAGLPILAKEYPDEPRLRETIRAVADFLSMSQDPLGGWRYPHPRSSSVLLSQALEHAWQIVQADKLLGPDDRHLDAIERVLRQRYHGWRQTGKTLGGVGAWEVATGKVKSTKELYALYQKPNDRDSSRDYKEGSIGVGGSPPEGIVYFTEVLSFYLQHRPLDRITAPPEPTSPLGIVLARLRGETP